MSDRDRPLRPDLAEIEALSALLDAQTEVGDAPRPPGATRLDDGRSNDLAATARAVRVASGPRGLSRRFADRLEEDLMDLAALDRPHADAYYPRNPISPPAHMEVGEPLAGSRGRGRTGRRNNASASEGARPFPVASRRRGIVELAGFAAMLGLIALLFAKTLGGGVGNYAFWQEPSSPTPAAVADAATPADASATPATASVAFERGNPGRTGVYDTRGPEERPALLWRHNDPNLDPIEALEPIVAGDRAYVSIQRGNFTAVTDFTLPEGTGGFGSWLLTSDEGVNVAFAHGLIYAASLLSADQSSGEVSEVPALVAYDQATNEERWRVEVDFAAGTSPVVAGDTLLVLSTDGLIALDALTGEGRWRAATTDFPGGVLTGLRNPAVEGDTVVVNELERTQGAVKGVLRAFDLKTGELRWNVESEGEFDSPAISDGMVYVSESFPAECCFVGRLWAFDAATGEVAWAVPAADEDSHVAMLSVSPVVDADSVYTLERGADDPTSLVARDKRTGAIRWRRDVGEHYGAQMSLAGGTLYYTLPDGGVYAARAEDGEELWRVDTGDPSLGMPILADGYLVIASSLAIYAFGQSADDAAAASDVSGLPACESPRTLADAPPTGEPADSLVELEENPLGYGIPFGGRMLLADVPEGEAAPDAAVVGILATLRAMTACDRPGAERELGGFYSDDYFRRFGAIEGKPGSDESAYAELFPVDTLEIGDLGAPYLLPDGRVGLLAFDPLGDRGTLLVFVEADGAWMIDEVVDIGRDPEVWRQG